MTASLIHRLLCALLVLLGLGALLHLAGSAPAPPSNIIILLADYLGAHDLGCTGSGFYETPHLDRLSHAFHSQRPPASMELETARQHQNLATGPKFFPATRGQ